MASTKSYLEYVLDLLSGLDGISYRAMMGEYVLYYQDRVFGGIYDDRFLVKPVKAAVAKISSILAGPFLVFIICCGIYCVVKANWQSLLILALVGGGCVLFYVLVGLLLGAIDIAGAKMKRFIRS